MIKTKKDQKIECLECGKYFKKLGGSHLEAIHKMTIKEYLLKHPSAKTSSNVFRFPFWKSDFHSIVVSPV